MDPYIFGFFTIAYVVILLWGLKKHAKTASAVLFFVILALIYDNFVLAIGHLIGEGSLLENLSIGRFWLHAIFTPTLILFSYFVLREANSDLVKKSYVKIGFFGFFIVAVIVQFIMELADLQLEIQEEYGVVSYSSTEVASGPPPMILLVIVALFIAAVWLAWKRKWWWMLVGIILMTIGSAFPINVRSHAITNLFELTLLITLMWTAIHFANGNRR